MKKFLCVTMILSTMPVYAESSRTKAWDLHKRIASVPPTPAVLNQMTTAINANPGQTGLEEAASFALQNKDFYNVTLKAWAKTLTNVNHSNRVPLDDMSATIIGAARDSDQKPFGRILHEDVIYIGSGTGLNDYSPANNGHYEELENSGANLLTRLVERRQSDLGSVSSPGGIAGILSSRSWAQAYFDMGTNRRATFYLLKNFMCSSMEYIMDTSLPDSYVARDVTRSPGGDATEFKSYCVGCHAAQDAMRPAWAYNDYDASTGRLTYTPGEVPQKLNRGADTFPAGFVTTNDEFKNFWGSLSRHNEKLGFKAPFQGSGPADLGRQVAESRGFANCMTYKTFKNVCYRNPSQAENQFVEDVASAFENDGNLKSVFAKVAAHCVEDKYEEQ